jgi:hypothetical protein
VSVPGFALLWFGGCSETLSRVSAASVRKVGFFGSRSTADLMEPLLWWRESQAHVRQDSSEVGRTHAECRFFGIDGRHATNRGLLADRLGRLFGGDDNETWELGFGRGDRKRHGLVQEQRDFGRGTLGHLDSSEDGARYRPRKRLFGAGRWRSK